MRALLAPAIAAIFLTSCGSAPVAEQAMSPEEHRQDVEQWQRDRVARLMTDDGWLTLVGLYWIEDGTSKVGSDPLSDVVLPASMPKETGTISLNKGKAKFIPASGVDLQETELKPDAEPDYPVVRMGSARFYLIERGGRYGIRVKDSASEARKNFAGLVWYPVDPSWRVEAKFVPSPHQVTYATDVGVVETGESMGYAEFERDGHTFRLDSTREDDELFFVIRDETSGKTTYSAARFIYTGLPQNGRLVIDFNRAYNPPCVFTDFATCPLPPSQNRMDVAVEAGEKAYSGHL